MSRHRGVPQFFEIPHAMVFVLLTLNVLAYGLCLAQSGSVRAPAEILFRYGAMYSLAVERHEYWRLVGYGFLHADILHLTMNMACLVLWGAHLEKRVGSLYFILIYLASIVTGALVSAVTHSGPFLTVGASGGLSGIMGALLCLWILGKIDLSVNFFAINIGLNVALALTAPNIDSGAHFGGFAAGVISCALLDLLEKANSVIFRCKFPEFVKMNLFVLLVASAIWLSDANVGWISRQENWIPLLALLITATGVIKLLDVILSIKKGLAIIVLLLSMLNGGLALFSVVMLSPAACAPGSAQVVHRFEETINLACNNGLLAAAVVAAGAVALTLLAYSHALDRGVKDVGFVASSLRAERRRHQGI
jgi:membrane associated rhomboid family serine protease